MWWVWFGLGVVSGLGLAVVLFFALVVWSDHDWTGYWNRGVCRRLDQ